MSATWSIDDEVPARHPLARGARPQDIRDALPPTDRAEFEAALEEAVDRFKASLDFDELFALLDRWRKIAVLQSDPERFARIARRAAALHTGHRPAADAEAAAVRPEAGTSSSG